MQLLERNGQAYEEPFPEPRGFPTRSRPPQDMEISIRKIVRQEKCLVKQNNSHGK
jgi:hypothetical protein